MATPNNPTVQGTTAQLLARGIDLRDQLTSDIQVLDSISLGPLELLRRRRIKSAEHNLAARIGQFVEYERSMSDLIYAIARSPNIISLNDRFSAALSTSQLAAQRESLRSLLATLQSQIADRRQQAEARIASMVNLSLLALTIIAIVVALASYRVAVKTLEDARTSAVNQQEANRRQIEGVEKSRQALEVVSATIKNQEGILKANADSAAAQAAILKRQQQRELEQADIRAVLFYPKNPSIVIQNRGPNRVARDVVYEVRFWNLSTKGEKSYGLLGCNVEKIDYILPRRAIGPNVLHCYPSGVSIQPKNGDRLFGYATIQCPECTKARVYWIFIVYGQDGVFVEGKNTEYPFFSLNLTNAEQTVATFLSRKDLSRMRDHLGP